MKLIYTKELTPITTTQQADNMCADMCSVCVYNKKKHNAIDGLCSSLHCFVKSSSLLKGGTTPETTEIPRNFCDPASSQHHNSGGVHVKKKIKPIISQLRALATHTPIWGRIAQGALGLFLPQIR